MSLKRFSLSRSLHFLNSLLVFVFALFMLDEIYGRLHALPWIWPALIVAIPVKIYTYSGIYGYLTELASGEELTLNWKGIQKNARTYWPLYTAVMAVSYGVHFFAYLFFPPFRLCSFQLFFPFVGILTVYFLAGSIIKNKYIQTLKLRARPLNVQVSDLMVLLGFYVMEVALTWLPAFLPMGQWDWPRLTFFAVKYIHLLEFLYIAFIVLDVYREIPDRFDQAKEIFLINPVSGGVVDGLAFLSMRGYPPVFVVLKALTPKGYRFREFNRLIWRDRYYKSNKLVAITCYTPNCAEAYKIAKEFKKRGSKVVMGGPHVTYLPEEALAFCDSVVIGEAEAVWQDVVRDFENNTLKSKYMGVAVEDYHAAVHKELMRSPPHVIKEFLETTRGCKYRCHFCTIPSLSGGRTRKKPVEEIVALINKIKHRYRTVTFIDNNIYSDPAYAKELFAALKPLKIKWRTQCTIDIAKNEETLRLAKESGCDGFLFGYEIFGGSLEKQQGGKFAMAQRYIEYTNIIKKMGIKIKAHFIFGFDSDSFKNLGELWRFCFKIMPVWTIVSVLTPLPGSRVYYEMLAANRITNLNWRSYAMHNLVIRHPKMNEEWVSKVFPFIRNLFLLTTSSGGMVLLCGMLLIFIGQIYHVRLF